MRAEPLGTADLAYVAGIVDTMAVLRVRKYAEADLPMVAVHCPNLPLLGYLARLTGTKVTKTSRGYDRAGCSEHCPDKHQHITSTSGRWSVSGAKATVLLAAVRPFLRLQGYAADQVLEAAAKAPSKPATWQRMVELGWPLPDLPNAAHSPRTGGANLTAAGAVVRPA